MHRQRKYAVRDFAMAEVKLRLPNLQDLFGASQPLIERLTREMEVGVIVEFPGDRKLNHAALGSASELMLGYLITLPRVVNVVVVRHETAVVNESVAFKYLDGVWTEVPSL